MTRSYKRETRVFPKDEEGFTSLEKSYVEKIDTYSFSIYPGDDESFTVSKNGVCKTVKIESDSSCIYKLQKNKIRARGGALGLFKYIDDCIYEDFCACLAWKVLDYILDSAKSA